MKSKQTIKTKIKNYYYDISNKEEARKVLNRGGYPTRETIVAFSVVYPALFEDVMKRLGYVKKGL